MKRVISTLRLVLLFSYVILIAHALAETPEGLKNTFTSRRQRYLEARRLAGTTVRSRPLMDLGKSVDQVSPESENWAGAVQDNLPSGTFNKVQAQYILPTVYVPPGASGAGLWGVIAFVGIDGIKPNCGGLLQAGSFTYVEVDSNGGVETGTEFFGEWPPANAVPLDLIGSPGQTIAVSVTALSLSEGQVVVNNLATQKSVTASFSSAGAGNNLCGLYADYIVEDPFDTTSNALLPFAKFDPITFFTCAATTTTGVTVDLTGATTITLIQNGVVLASVGSIRSDGLSVKYGG